MFTLVKSGPVADVGVLSLAASGVVKSRNLVDWVRNGTGGAIVTPTTSASTSTMVFGLCCDYAQGASDTFVKVVPLDSSCYLEADCANAATTAQLGIRHALSASDRACIHNTASDVVSKAGIFLALQMVGSTSGSGKLIGRIVRTDDAQIQIAANYV